MKVALIVIVSILLVAFAGVFVYGIMQGTPTVRDPGTKAAGDAPDPALFDSTPAINLAAIVEDESISDQKKAADLLLGAAYNLIRIKQFYFFARVDVDSGKEGYAISEYTFTKENAEEDHLNQIKIVQAYTGSIDTYVIRAYYEGQKLTKKGTVEYDDGQWIYAVPTLTESEIESKTKSKDEETPYYLYSVLDFPLDFGGLEVMEDGVNDAGRTEEVDYSMVDPDSLEIEYNKEKGYYTVTFDMIVSALNNSQETKDRLSDTTSSGKMKSIDFKSFTVTMEIWKETGAFRSLSYETDIEATINSKRGGSKITKEINFSYDDENCSVAKKIKEIKDDKGNLVFYNALSSENKSKCDAEVNALAAEKPADAKADEDDDALAA